MCFNVDVNDAQRINDIQEIGGGFHGILAFGDDSAVAEDVAVHNGEKNHHDQRHFQSLKLMSWRDLVGLRHG